MLKHFIGKNRVGVLILNVDTGKVLVTRDPNEKIFEIPGGRMDADENIEENIIRETKEELNIDLVNISPEYIFSLQEIHGRENSLQLSMFFKINLNNDEIKDLKFSDEVEEVVWVDKNDFKNYNYFNSTLKALEKYFKTE